MQSIPHSYCRKPSRYYFGCAEFCPETLELSVLGEVLALERRPLRLLRVLLEHADQVVSHEELFREVWDGRITVRNVLPNAMTKLRKALGRDAKLIVTIAGVGYRLNGPVRFDSAQSETITLASTASPNRPSQSANTDVTPLPFVDDSRSEWAAKGQPASSETEACAPSDVAKLLREVPMQRRLDAFELFAERIGARHTAGMAHERITKPDVTIFADGRLLLLARRLREGPSLVAQDGQDVYRAPELYRGQAVSAQSDIYALGVLLYQLCCADLQRPLLSDWKQDVGDGRCHLLIEAATRANPLHRPASVRQWLALSHCQPEGDTPASPWQRMLRLPVKLSRRVRLDQP